MSRLSALLALAVVALTAHHPHAQSRPVAGMVIARTMVVPAGTYPLASADLDHPAITIRGSNLTVDFRDVVLRGAAADADPDSFTGLAVLVDGGENVTIRNLRAHGYKIGVLARGSRNLHITHADLSYNWKPRLYSLVEHESLLDWMSYHHNDKDEWLQSGAGIYLADSPGAEIDHTTIVQGQNGLMLARSDNAKVWNNTFSFLSGLGIALYRASGNTIMHNKVDWCVRGYSHTFYNRGQDSAGILLYEQSHKNLVAFNSVTHGGDGLFLWAGQSTMDTGQGGANDNLFYDNDFSFAPANGIEATFSRNIFYGNRVEECWHGVWGGYSFDSWFVANRFARNTEAIAIEHGQDNKITENRFEGDETAIRLWRNAAQDPDWGYPKHRDTRSRDYVINGNTFVANHTALKISETQNVRILTNSFERVQTLAMLTGDTRNLGIGDEVTVPLRPRPTLDVTLPKPLPGGMDAKIPEAERRGREAIIVDEWGPYDWKSPKLWPQGRSDATPLKLRVLGPPGEWKVASLRGASLDAASGRVPGVVTLTPAPGPVVDYDVQLTYLGAAVVSPRGRTVAAGAPYAFGYRRFFVPAAWQVRYFTFDEASRPDRNPDGFARVLAGAPAKSDTRDRLDYMSGGVIAEGLPRDRVALVAEAQIDLPPGAYTVRTISDDGVRVWMDEERIVDRWTPHESAIDTVPITGGRRRFKVEYFEIGGFAELRFEILRR
ncbi:MAG TPA: right-handed parallel beta-helix repeat-containing protein [Vicinamibacterales bacterium]|nr:right-handed parallel beta-helix repeat-containing protein [Vicinamibacterales bacterium]